ncbi:MAG: deoxyribonuclease IV [Acidobacteria bacterium]|nr:deoxyribonuclease IV [Acidobacteriota bacterium]
MRIGAHMSIAGGMDLAVDRAQALGCEALQVFVKSSNQWAARPLKEDEVARFRDKVGRAGLQPVVAHDSYLVNVGSCDPALWRKSLDALDVELSRCEVLGIPYLVMHPGAHCGAGEDAAFAAIARALNELHAKHRGASVTILLENTAGQGTVVGHRFEQLKAIIDRVRRPERLGVCFDTQHAFAAGYDLATEAGWQATWDEFDRVLGRDRLLALHLNDSKKPLGSRVDRHEHIGLGLLGAATFVRLVNDARFEGLPASIETEKTDDGFEDAQNLAVLRALRGRKRAPSPATIARWRGEALRRARAAR